MKTINSLQSHDQIFDRQKESKNNKNTIARLGQKIAERLEDLDDHWAHLATYAEPKIWEKKDRYGNTYFRVYDPKSDHHIYFNSEDEVRWWLDKRYSL